MAFPMRRFDRVLRVFALLAALGAGATGLHAEDAVPITVATWNLRLNLAADGPNTWARRVDAVRALIRFHGFDLFGTQEGLPEQIADLATMPEFAHAGVGRDDGRDAGEHSAIFYRTARFALLEQGDFWFSETPERPSKGWDARCCNRLASWVRLREKASGRSVLVVSVHFDHEGPVARRESARLLLRWLGGQAPADAVIALGDFNSTPETEQIVAMKAALRDARDAALTPPYGPEATFNDFRFGTPPSARIDYIFVGPTLRVAQYAVLTDSDGQRYPSDHFPVMARLLLGP